ncbi:LysR family transcriptional regulator [Lachnoclostridium sp. An118]|uniref:LysR family transcriptional regulator n=1 Tax=Lachnoclostridium sp. An118 TaxID=1965547 RepID=UPI000B39011E|nr:LysR family transcriptional regulator [Lachnoclostridium sp. An118]OUQ48882.1 LysR family transcriptional regulator [Lachnoclostridium sp. An118]HJA44526.1 LysR family transcriptional regulator [Candidatus Dorea stercoravium]
MNLAEIETFLMIVKTKNITKTAENLFLSQPTVSHRLKSLEDELDVKLITRKKGYKQIELTTQGEEFIPIAERWVSIWQEMQLLKHTQDRLYLTVGCTDTMNSAIFFDLYRQILKEKDHVINLHIKTHYSYELYGLLENHEIDIGFVYHHLHFKNIVTEPIMREKMYILQSARMASQQNAIHTDDLDPQKEIFVSWEANYQIWHDQTISKGEWPRIQVDTFELLFHLLSDETLWAIVPVSVAERIASLRPVHISEIANSSPPPERITYKIKHKYPNEATLKAVNAFEKKISAYLRTKDWGFVGK